MGLSASQGRMLLLTARRSDLEYRAQQISQRRLMLSQELESVSTEYEEATSNRQMKMTTWLNGVATTDSTSSSKSTNLTYATLVSGCGSLTSTQSGLNLSNYSFDYASTTAYRLVDSDGAIVVASTDEIPQTVTSSSSTKTAANDSGIYTVTNKNSSDEVTSSSYYVAPKEGTALYTALGLSSSTTQVKNVEVTENGVVRIGTTNGSTTTYQYYKLSDGSEITATTDESGNVTSTAAANAGVNDSTTWLSATAVTDSSTIPDSTTESEGGTLEGTDGKYTLYDANHVEVARYVVDAALSNGSTDANGSTSGPNYLQDCIRNGKYLIQKGYTDTNDNDEYKWQNTCWDSLSNLSDSYYTDDDDTAKAKYDRLTNEVEAQDKKLELELDNIETQREAVTTEEESVQKVIDDNIEGSFNAFA